MNTNRFSIKPLSCRRRREEAPYTTARSALRTPQFSGSLSQRAGSAATNLWRNLSLLFIAAAVGLCAAGCSFLKPSGIEPRLFVLTPLPSISAANAPTTVAVGIGPVSLPAYLLKNSIAVRSGTNEITYLETSAWAERLDAGLQRVIAVNLASLLPTDRVHTSAWRREEVNVEVFVTVEQFDVDQSGNVVLAARWRVLAPGGERELKVGRFQRQHSGPAPESDPRGATLVMSELAADLSNELAEAIRSSVP